MERCLASWFREQDAELDRLAQDLWSHPELALHEFQTAELVGNFMQAQGFRVERRTICSESEKPNCIVARWGAGKPVIGLIGDMDAFPDTRNEPGPREARSPGAGHACGHHLVTESAMAAACALKRAIEASGIEGSVVFFGCPAEEAVGGKYFMALEGLFDGVDVCFQWHPSSRQMIFGQVAVKSVLRMEFTFEGDRSRIATALYSHKADDAAKLMVAASGFIEGDRFFPRGMTFSCTTQPKSDLGRDEQVVIAHARYQDFAVTQLAKEKYIALAKGAAMMAGCDVHWRVLGHSRHSNPNLALNRYTYEAAKKVPPAVYDEEDYAFAHTLVRNYWHGREPSRENVLADPFMLSEWYREHPDGTPDLIPHDLEAPRGEPWVVGGGSDLSHVTFIAPTIYVTGHGGIFTIPGHTWANNVTVGSSIGRKAMKYAAGILAQAAWDLLTEPDKMHTVRTEFLERQKTVGTFAPVALGEEGSFSGREAEA